MRGDAPPAAGADALVQAVAGHLRALLRDVICGHLGRDLVTLADDLLLGPEAVDASDADSDPTGEGVEDWFSDAGGDTHDEPVAARLPRPRFGRTAPDAARRLPRTPDPQASDAERSRAPRAPVRAEQGTLPF